MKKIKIYMYRTEVVIYENILSIDKLIDVINYAQTYVL